MMTYRSDDYSPERMARDYARSRAEAAADAWGDTCMQAIMTMTISKGREQLDQFTAGSRYGLIWTRDSVAMMCMAYHPDVPTVEIVVVSEQAWRANHPDRKHFEDDPRVARKIESQLERLALPFVSSLPPLTTEEMYKEGDQVFFSRMRDRFKDE